MPHSFHRRVARAHVVDRRRGGDAGGVQQGGGDLALRPGTRVRVIASAAQAAPQVIVPESAVIADGGALWCYVRAAERNATSASPLDGDHRVAAGYPAPAIESR